MSKVFRDKDGNEIPQGVPFEFDGLAFPANWLELADADDLARFGIVETIEPDVEAPPPAPMREMTPAEKLKAVGLSVDDLKGLLT